MIEAFEKIIRRGANISSPEEFAQSEAGSDALDGIALMIIAVGESAKRLDKASPSGFLADYPSVDWKRMKGMRDFISHEYFSIDPNIVFKVAKEHAPKALEVLKKMRSDLAAN